MPCTANSPRRRYERQRASCPFGGPLRLRVPRQLGYKNVKYITRLTITDNLKRFGKGLGSAAPEGGYAWYAGSDCKGRDIASSGRYLAPSRIL